MAHPVIDPVAITCGDTSGIGLEVTLKAWKALQDAVPFFLIADPKHLPADAAISLIADPGEAAAALPKGVPVLPHNFAADAIRGKPTPATALGVVEVKLTGMVRPDRTMITYYVDFTRVIDRRLKMGVADGRVVADGEEIYAVKDMKVGLATAS